MAYEAEGVVSHVEGMAAGILGAAFIGMAQARQQAAADRKVHAARCAGAAAGARAHVLADTVDSLRERLADAVDDAEGLRDLVADLQAQVRQLTADRRILGAALQARRAA